MASVTPKCFFLLCGAVVFLTFPFFWTHVSIFTQSVYGKSDSRPPRPMRSWLPNETLSMANVSLSTLSDLHGESEKKPKNVLTGAGNHSKAASSDGDSGTLGSGNGKKPDDFSTSGNRSKAMQAALPSQWNKFLIFECVGNAGLCGGWGDRQEGLVTVFLLANLTNRRFGIRMTTPCDLKKFLLPNEYNWIVSDQEIQGKQTRRISAIDKTLFSREMPTVDFNAKYPEDVVFLQTNRDLLKDITTNPHYRDKLPPWARQPRPEFFRDAWRMLMKLSPHMEQRLEEFLHSVHYFNRSRMLVGVHVRIGGSAHFSDYIFKGRMSQLDALWGFVQPYVSNGSDVFVATDNLDVRQSSMAKFGHHHHDTEAVLRHIDRQRSDPAICQAFGGAILDQKILTHCDVLVVSPGSGFSSRAAMIRGVKERLFEFGSNGVSPADMYKMCEPIC